MSPWDMEPIPEEGNIYWNVCIILKYVALLQKIKDAEKSQT